MPLENQKGTMLFELFLKKVYQVKNRFNKIDFKLLGETIF